jgi:hypothetical protein
VLPGLLPFAPSFVDLGQAKVGRSSAVEEMVGNATVNLESLSIPPQGMEKLSPNELLVLLVVERRDPRVIF